MSHCVRAEDYVYCEFKVIFELSCILKDSERIRGEMM